MKILVTGGAGFIGSHLLDRLLTDGHEVTVLDNLSRGLKQNIEAHINSQKFIFVEGDIRDRKTVDLACKGCEIVYHLAAQSNVMGAVTDVRYSYETNVNGTFNLLESASAHGVKRFIFSSSREAYGEAQQLPVKENHPLQAKNAYGASKACAEMYCRVFQGSNNMEIVVLRLGNVYGLRDFNRVIPIFINNIRTGRELIIFGGKQIIDFIAVPLVIEVMVQSQTNLEAKNQPINVASGVGTTLLELAETLMRLMGSKQPIKIEPARDVEVVRFIADIQLLKMLFSLRNFPAPLAHLEKMIE